MTKFRKLPKVEEQLSTELLHDRDGDRKSRESVAQADSAPPFSSNGSRKATLQEIELVQNLIERCLVLYMTRDEVVTMLENHAKLDPRFISLVWQRLEEENPEFFSAYHLRLNLKKQIILFNQLLEKQYHLTNNRENYNAMQHSLHNGLSHFPVDSSIGYPAQLPYLPCAGATYMDPLHSGSLNYMVNGVPTASNFYPSQQSVDAASASDDQHMDTEFNHQFFLKLDESLRMNGQSVPQLDAAFPSKLYSVDGFQHGMDCGGGNSSSVNLSSPCNLTRSPLTFEGSSLLLTEPIPDVLDIELSYDEIVDFFADGPFPEETQMQRHEEKS